ncbi:MAG TPA: YHS domain-containing protein [Planctomycetaceae bacterium]|nr:YHS domain-containing protein [Planctomycetaceae bacterium]
MSATIPTQNVAIGGYDPVAYFANSAKAGDPLHSFDYEGQTYYFATAENKQLFQEEPAKYAPLYGGYCATAASEGKLFGVDPTNFKITDDGKLALFYRGEGGDTLPQWNENEAERRLAADQHWKNGTLKSGD